MSLIPLQKKGIVLFLLLEGVFLEVWLVRLEMHCDIFILFYFFGVRNFLRVNL